MEQLVGIFTTNTTPTFSLKCLHWIFKDTAVESWSELRTQKQLGYNVSNIYIKTLFVGLPLLKILISHHLYYWTNEKPSQQSGAEVVQLLSAIEKKCGYTNFFETVSMNWAETFSLCRDILIAIIYTRSLHVTLYKRVLTKNTKRNLSKSFRFHTCHKMGLRVSKEKPNQNLQKDWAMYNLRSSKDFLAVQCPSLIWYSQRTVSRLGKILICIKNLQRILF